MSHYPETGRSSDLYVYAINKFGVPLTDISITREGGLPTSAVECGQITKNSVDVGFFLKVNEINGRRPGSRYGRYIADFYSPLLETFLSFEEHRSYTFVKPKSGLQVLVYLITNFNRNYFGIEK